MTSLMLIIGNTDRANAESHTQIPIIPKPAFQPGLPEDTPRDDPATFAAAAQDYFLKSAARLTNGFIGAVAALAVLMLIISGIQMLVAYGDEEKITSAKKTATWAIFGLLLTILAYAIVSILNTLPITVLDTSAAEG